MNGRLAGHKYVRPLIRVRQPGVYPNCEHVCNRDAGLRKVGHSTLLVVLFHCDDCVRSSGDRNVANNSHGCAVSLFTLGCRKHSQHILQVQTGGGGSTSAASSSTTFGPKHGPTPGIGAVTPPSTHTHTPQRKRRRIQSELQTSSCRGRALLCAVMGLGAARLPVKVEVCMTFAIEEEW